MKICVHHVFRAPFLPCGETASPGRGDASHAAICLGDMSTQGEADMIREELGDLPGCVKRRQE